MILNIPEEKAAINMAPTKKKILFLYAEVMGYTVAIFKALVNEYEAEVHVLELGVNKKKSKYKHADSYNGIFFYSKDEYDSLEKIKELIDSLGYPDLLYISGWMDSLYLKTARYIRSKNIPVVAGMDTQWRGDLRQRAACYLFGWYFRKCFNYTWCAGRSQFEYSRRLGFAADHIAMHCYSADRVFFEKLYTERKSKESQHQYPKNFLFLGRFDLVKGIDVLVDAFVEFSKMRSDWTLTLIGNGPLKNELCDKTKDIENIKIKDFIQPEDLREEFLNTGVFILPSVKEPWGVVIHELASAGVPLITSDVCGASTEFLIDGYNGYKFMSKNVDSLLDKMIKITSLPEKALIEMGKRSNLLSQRISPSFSAANLMSILEQ
jgi:glycosyltransferase involved in cell wall biosynthesis